MNDRMRILINEIKSLVIESSELWGFIRLSPKTTSLPYDIYVDNGKSYVKRNHDLWLYVQVGGNKIPVTISNAPILKKPLMMHGINLEPLYDFISANKNILIKLANEEIEDGIFFSLLKPYSGKQPISEMATLHKEKSGLQMTVWLDDDKLYLPHAPRIKFRADKQNNDTHNDPSMEIKNPDKIHNMTKCDLSAKDIFQLKAFVRHNQTLLLQLADKEIDYAQFQKEMKLVDDNGNVIETDTPEIGKIVNGFALYKKGDKYNFLREDGTFLFNEPIFDLANNFDKYGDDIYLAYVTRGSDSYFIDTEGNRVVL